MTRPWHKVVVFVDQILDRLRTYVESLTTDQLEAYFLGLMGLGLILALYLLYSIYRRSASHRASQVQPPQPDVEIASTTGLAELLRERPTEEDRKKKHNAWSFSLP